MFYPFSFFSGKIPSRYFVTTQRNMHRGVAHHNCVFFAQSKRPLRQSMEIRKVDISCSSLKNPILVPFTSSHLELFLRKGENMQQICRRKPMPKCDFNKVNLLHISRTLFPKNTSGWLLLSLEIRCKFLRFWKTVRATPTRF